MSIAYHPEFDATQGVRGAIAVGRQLFAVVARVKHPGQAQLPMIVHTRDPLRFRLGRRQGREQQTRQNRDDGNHHQQFNQGETGSSAGLSPVASSRRLKSFDATLHGCCGSKNNARRRAMKLSVCRHISRLRPAPTTDRLRGEVKHIHATVCTQPDHQRHVADARI